MAVWQIRQKSDPKLSLLLILDLWCCLTHPFLLVYRVYVRTSQIANVLRPMLANPSPNHRADNHRELILAQSLKRLLFNSLRSCVHLCANYIYMFRGKKIWLKWRGKTRVQRVEEGLVRVVEFWLRCYPYSNMSTVLYYSVYVLGIRRHPLVAEWLENAHQHFFSATFSVKQLWSVASCVAVIRVHTHLLRCTTLDHKYWHHPYSSNSDTILLTDGQLFTHESFLSVETRISNNNNICHSLIEPASNMTKIPWDISAVHTMVLFLY